MSTLVVDASVAIKWVVAEEESPLAEALPRAGHHLIAPELLLAECANILWKKQHLGLITPEHVAFAARSLAASNVELLRMAPLFERACEIAINLDHPAYDCMYLAVAEWAYARMVTADARLARKLRAHARFAERVVGLGDTGALR